MKKIIVFAGLMAGVTFLKAQDAAKASSASEIVFYGLDFTKAKFVGQFDQGMGAMPATGMDIRNKWIPNWNGLMEKEQQNFDIKKAFKKDNVYYDFKSVNDLNSKIEPDKIMVPNPGQLQRSDIDAMVKNYKLSDKKDGVGLVFIVENYDKSAESATVFVTFFDIATGKVLACQLFTGKAGGVGMRNYWAGAIKHILKDARDNDVKKWK